MVETMIITNPRIKNQMDPHLKKWKDIIKADDLAKSLEDHFLSIGVTKRAAPVLRAFCKTVIGAKIANNQLVLIFPWKHDETPVIIYLNAPYEGTFDESVPKSFQKFYREHNGLSYFHSGEENPSFEICPVNTNGRIENTVKWEHRAIEKVGNSGVLNYLKKTGKTPKDVVCFGSYNACQNWFLIHPFKKRKNATPRIIMFEREICNMSAELSTDPFPNFIVSQLALWVGGIRKQKSH